MTYLGQDYVELMQERMYEVDSLLFEKRSISLFSHLLKSISKHKHFTTDEITLASVFSPPTVHAIYNDFLNNVYKKLEHMDDVRELKKIPSQESASKHPVVPLLQRFFANTHKKYVQFLFQQLPLYLSEIKTKIDAKNFLKLCDKISDDLRQNKDVLIEICKVFNESTTPEFQYGVVLYMICNIYTFDTYDELPHDVMSSYQGKHVIAEAFLCTTQARNMKKLFNKVRKVETSHDESDESSSDEVVVTRRRLRKKTFIEDS